MGLLGKQVQEGTAQTRTTAKHRALLRCRAIAVAVSRSKHHCFQHGPSHALLNLGTTVPAWVLEPTTR